MIDALYIHIPFCDKICTYCDFSKILSTAFDHQTYLDALFQEYTIYRQTLEIQEIKTIYFGGGTPSALNTENLERLLSFFEREISDAEEVTFEANPESLSQDKIKLLGQYGVTRVSMGVQTFHAKQLRFLGRHHSIEDVEKVARGLREEKLTNFNFDLIYALPHQTLEMFQADVKKLLTFQPEHISSYALIVEERTKISLDIDAGKYSETDENIQFAMYEFLKKTLKEHGYIHYEVSNWSRSTNGISQHNMTYWSMKDYLGIGLGSHGFIENTRYANTKSITKYVQKLLLKELPVVYKNELTRKELMEEMMFLGLRKRSGVDANTFVEFFGESMFDVFGHVLEKHIKLGNIIIEDTMVFLSSDAIFISNEVLSDFIL